MSENLLSSLPENWRLVRLKNVVELRTDRIPGSARNEGYVGLENVQSWTGKLLSATGVIDTSEDDDEKQNVVNIFDAGNVLFGKLRPYLAKAHLAQHSGICSTELLVFKSSKYVEPEFLLQTILAKRFIDQVNAETFGVKMPRADWDTISNVSIALPPLATQRAIAAYLDRETAKIDAMIDAKQRLLGLLAEKRQALITHAVTRGLDPDAPMKDSGVEWIGAVPKHWRVEEAGRLFDEIDQRSITGEEELLTVSHLTGVTRRSEKDVNMFMAETNEGYKWCQAGDLVINTLWAWMGAMGVASEDGIVSPAYNVYRPKADYDSWYVDVLVRIPIFAQEVTRYSKGVWSSRLRLYPDEFFLVGLPVPPVAEQQQIIKHIQTETKKIDQLLTVAHSTLEMLQERRAALISEAVTGQLQIAE